jgi:nucleotide-binding universal stress UspA family protein
MKKILVPTDFSEQANYALKAAAKIAKQTKGTIYLLHMIDIPDLQGFKEEASIPEIVFFKKISEQKLNDQANQSFLKDIEVHKLLKLLKTFKGVQEVSKDYDIDLIIMGSHGASGMKEFLIGSNTEKVVRTSEVPVLVIKGKIENIELKNITFASNYELKDKPNYISAVKIAKTFKATLNLLYINTPSNFNTTTYIEQKMATFDGEYSKIKKYIYNDFSIEKGVLNFNEKNNADLTIINTNGRTGIAHFFNGSISEDLVNHSDRPILTFKIKK